MNWALVLAIGLGLIVLVLLAGLFLSAWAASVIDKADEDNRAAREVYDGWQ